MRILFAALIFLLLPCFAAEAQFNLPIMMGGGKPASSGSSATITGVSISCGSGCSFTTPGATGTAIGTLAATVSTGTPSVTWALSTSADVCNPTNGAGNSNFQIVGSSLQILTSGLGAGTYAGCAVASGAYSNSPNGIAFSVTGSALAAGFFVDVASHGGTCNDSYTNTQGLSVTTPFCSLQRAQSAMQATSTKTAYLRAGTWEALNYSPVSGCSSSSVWMSFGSSDNGETWSYYPPDGYNTAVLNAGPSRAFENTTNRDQGFCVFSSNFTINGLKFTNFGAASIYAGSMPNGVIKNNIVDTTLWEGTGCCGCIFLGDMPGGLIDHNAVLNCINIGIGQGGTSGQWTNLTISNNFIYNSGINWADSGCIYGIELSPTSTNIHITNNYVRDCHKGTGPVGGDPGNGFGGRSIYLDQALSNVTVTGNISSGVFGECLFNHAGANNLYNNNICDTWNQNDQIILTEQGAGAGYPGTGNTAHNNIVITKNNGGGGRGYSDSGVSPNAPTDIRNNMYHNYGTGGNMYTNGDAPAGAPDQNPVHADPQFVTCPSDPSTSWNYVLSGLSPAFGAPVSFTDIGRTWGPPGYAIPKIGTPPSYGPC